MDELKAERASGVQEGDDEQSVTLKIIRDFQVRIVAGERIERERYDKFGNEILE